MSALIMAGETSASAYDVKHTPNGSLVHWESNDVHFNVSPSVDAITGARGAVSGAFDAWSGHEGAPVLHDDGNDIPAAPKYDGKNGVFFAPGGFAPAGKALAITILTYDNQTGKVLDADVVVNGKYQFQVLPSSATGTHTSNAGVTDGVSHGDVADQGNYSPTVVYDLVHVLAHETGHSLGMNDEYVNGTALMYRFTAPNDATLRAPQSDDFQGLSKLYGANMTASGGCGESRVSPVKPSSKTGTVAFALGLGLLAYVMLRRRESTSAASPGAAKRNARRAAAFISVAAFAIASVPEMTGATASAHAADKDNRGHATAVVKATRTTMSGSVSGSEHGTAAGLFRTEMKLETTECRVAGCSKSATFTSFGGTMGNVTQEVDGVYTPREGDVVDVSFEKTKSALAGLASPIGSRDAVLSSAVRVVTRAR
jgi:hypothetical protein